MFDARVRAVLGPTNTGKTHLAITRLLAHSSGIIGFPLRLLARENYDRMVAAKGARHVALITGEEKIVPPEAKWFACTVEAMPLDRRAEFVAVDEIQLCADPDRGHIFTDRLLHARGLVETMFLGAETIRPLLQRLVPQAEVETRPRLSQLTHAGPAKLTRLPARSAVVAFSAGEVYAIAEAIRRRRGGCAVVMGRLSPRTRNAQVALYQNREVDFLVATDAIGMGLNMDVDHVAFASLQKFDGQKSRILSAQEAAQIAGRAGRGMRDGSFGVTADCPPLPDEMVSKIENHQFEPLQALAWRNSDLDFSGIDALLDSLNAPPPQPGLSRGNDATDYITLATLAREPEIRALAQGRSRLQLLWEACQVPDFRKLADETHTRLCAKIFRDLAEDGRLASDWISGQIAGCASIEGDLDTLMARLASIRVWSYIAARADWLPDAATFQAEARRAEDGVSDALHERLTARFVDRRAAHLMRRLDEPEEELLSAVTRLGEVVVEGHPVGTVKGFVFEPDTTATGEDERRLVLRAARRALRDEMPRRVTALEQAKDEAFGLTPGHRVTWTYHPGMNAPAGLGSTAEVARLRPGPEPLKPHIDVLHSEFLDGAQRERIRLRLTAWLEALVKRELGGLEVVEAKAAEDGALRGPAYRLRETMGLSPGATEREVPAELRARLKAIGIRAGRYALYMPEVLKPRAMALRAQLWALRRNIPVPALPAGGLVSIPQPDAVVAVNPPPRAAAAAMPAEARAAAEEKTPRVTAEAEAPAADAAAEQALAGAAPEGAAPTEPGPAEAATETTATAPEASEAAAGPEAAPPAPTVTEPPAAERQVEPAAERQEAPAAEQPETAAAEQPETAAAERQDAAAAEQPEANADPAEAAAVTEAPVPRPAPPPRPLRQPAAPPASASWPQGFAQAMGWVPAGPVLVRLDVAERVAGELGFLTRRAPAPLPGDIASRLGVRGEALPAALEALGFRVLPATPLPEDVQGPPTPVRVGVLRPERPHHHGGPHRRPDQQRRGPPQGAEPGAEGSRPPRRHAGPRHGQPHGQPQRQPEGQPGASPAEQAATVAAEGAQQPGQQQRPPRRDGRPWQGGNQQRGDRPQQGGPGGGGNWRGDRQGRGGDQRQGSGGGNWRGDQQRPPRREDGDQRPPRRPREDEPGVPRPDSPFAILATLKLRKA